LHYILIVHQTNHFTGTWALVGGLAPYSIAADKLRRISVSLKSLLSLKIFQVHSKLHRGVSRV